MIAQSDISLQDRCIDDPFDLCDQNAEDVRNLAKAPVIWPRGMCYGYYNGSLVLVVHIRLRGEHGEPCNLCAVLYRAGFSANRNGLGKISGEIPLHVPL